MFAQSYPTAEYKEFYERGMEQLKAYEWKFEEEQKLHIIIRAYFSNRASDLDNVCKPTLDIMQKAFDFNDKYVYSMELYKHLVKKGEEKLEIEVKEYDDGID